MFLILNPFVEKWFFFNLGRRWLKCSSRFFLFDETWPLWSAFNSNAPYTKNWTKLHHYLISPISNSFYLNTLLAKVKIQFAVNETSLKNFWVPRWFKNCFWVIFTHSVNIHLHHNGPEAYCSLCWKIFCPPTFLSNFSAQKMGAQNVRTAMLIMVLT